MQFELFPLLERMIEFYQQPRGRQRFEDYLQMLRGDDPNNMEMPLPYFNPMAKDHVPALLVQLREIGAEAIMEQVIAEVNRQIKEDASLLNATFRVALSLADDRHGAWTNQYSTHYSNTFKPKGFLNYQFASPLFWTSEEQDSALVKHRTLETLWRTVYHQQNPFPETLAQHLQQEAFVQKKMGKTTIEVTEEIELVQELYLAKQDAEEQNIIIPFLYGDLAAESLGYQSLGLKAYEGLELAFFLINS